MLSWLGNALYRGRRVIPLVALLLVILAAFYGSSVFKDVNGTGFTDPNSESARADTLITEHFSSQTPDVVLLLSSTSLQVTDPAFAQAENTLIRTLKARPQVTALESYYSTGSANFISNNHHETFITITLTGSGDKTSQYNALKSYFHAAPLQVEAGGTVTANVQLNNQLSSDLEHGEMIGLPIVVVMLVLIFGGLVAAVMPLVIGGVVIAGAFAIIRFLTTITTVSSFATNVITIIGLGLAIDYSLFIITRFREELALHPDDTCTALVRTITTAGRTVLFSGLTVSTSLIALLLFPQPMLRSIGMAIIAVAVIAILATLTVLPVILALLGRHINALSLTRFIHIGPSHTSASTQSRGGWYVLSEWVMRGAIPIVFCVVALLLVLGSPFLNAKFSLSGSTALPTGTSARIVADRLSQDFPNQNKTTMDIVVQTTGSPLSSENLARLNTYVQRVLALPHMSSAQSLVTLDPHLTLAMYQQLYAHPSLNPAVQSASQQLVSGDMTLVTAQANIDPDSAAARALVTKVRSIAAPNGLTMQVGGTTADEVDQFASLDATIPAALAVMLCAILLLLFLMTGSVIMPLKAIVLNMLSLSAVFGSMVWIFQDGHLQRLLDFQASGSLDATEPILIFTIAFGLSMDYEVFLLSRIKEQFDKTGNNRESVSSGLQKTGWLITSAALLLAAVVAVFATSKIIMLKEMGIGLALAVLIDALLIRTLLVPSMMRLLGKWNWWAPRPLQVLWQRIGFQEYESEPETVFPDLDADQDEELVGSNA